MRKTCRLPDNSWERNAISIRQAEEDRGFDARSAVETPADSDREVDSRCEVESLADDEHSEAAGRRARLLQHVAATWPELGRSRDPAHGAADACSDARARLRLPPRSPRRVARGVHSIGSARLGPGEPARRELEWRGQTPRARGTGPSMALSIFASGGSWVAAVRRTIPRRLPGSVRILSTGNFNA